MRLLNCVGYSGHPVHVGPSMMLSYGFVKDSRTDAVR